MNLRFEIYKKKYLKSCAQMIKETWNFEKYLVNPKKPEYFYQYYILDCVNYSEHLELIVDDQEVARGILFGSIENAPYYLKIKYLLYQLKIRTQIWYHILNGDLGQRKTAISFYKSMKEINHLGETTVESFDSEVNLFILSPKLRGKGYGKELMDRYVEFCKDNQLRSSFLWTTLDCTYSFYERYGFELYKSFYYEDLTECKESKPNTMIYYLTIS